MKKTTKILKRTLLIAATIFAVVFASRIYNDSKYNDSDNSTTAEYYNDLTNINLYPTDIEGVDVKYVDENRFQGFHLTPNKKLYEGFVLCFGGSEGSPNFESAQELAKKGFETFVVFMCGMKNQQNTLVRIPLEQFDDILDYLNENKNDQGPISIIAASKGAEYALNLAGKYPEISNLVLIAPSSYNFAGLDFNDYGFSWTYEGEELHYIDIKKGSFLAFFKNIVVSSIVKAPISYKETYSSAVETDSNSASKLIPIDDVKANILLIAGEEDQLWDSLSMANEIKSQLSDSKLLSYKDAGHIYGASDVLNLESMRIKTGGSLEGNKKAQAESQEAIVQFLKDHHEH